MQSMLALAHAAAADTHARFGHRLMKIPGTWIGSSFSRRHRLADGSMLSDSNGFQHPLAEWNYWWQVHYLDAILDDADGLLAAGDASAGRRELRRGDDLLRGIKLRNFGVLPNYFFDDMAWLALASQRLAERSLAVTGLASNPAMHAARVLGKQLRGGIDDVLGGGMYWSRKKDFKNTPANAPAALYFARAGELAQARELLVWLQANLLSGQRGVYLDGLRLTADGRKLEPALYTYNQGPVLGVLLELGEDADLEHATALIHATSQQLADGAGVLSLNSGGDGNLFAGILCRYLALAAIDQRLDAGTRAAATAMITATAQRLRGQEPRRLSAAVQRWMILAAAAKCEAPRNA